MTGVAALVRDARRRPAWPGASQRPSSCSSRGWGTGASASRSAAREVMPSFGKDARRRKRRGGGGAAGAQPGRGPIARSARRGLAWAGGGAVLRR